MISGPIPQYLFFPAFLLLMAWAAYCDFARMEIPNRIPLAIAGIYFVHVFLTPVPVAPLGGFLTAAGLFIGGALLFHFGAMGGGDVKLMAAVGLWAGPDLIFGFLVIVGFAGGLLALVACTPLRFILGHAAANLTPRGGGAVSLPKGALPYGLAIAAGGVFVAVTRLAP